MAIGDRRYMARSEAERAQLDVGLRSYMQQVFGYMALGVGFTAAVSFLVLTSPALMQTVVSLFWVFFIGILGLGFFAPRIILTGSMGAAQAAFWVYSALWGALIAPMVGFYVGLDPAIVVRAFVITAATFAGTALVGYTTKRDLSGFAGFFMMASIGLVVAIVVNALFFHSVGASLFTSILVVLLFSGVTAWETQQIKTMYYETDGGEVIARKAIFGAFMLYGSFITLFVHILNILGIMRSN